MAHCLDFVLDLAKPRCLSKLQERILGAHKNTITNGRYVIIKIVSLISIKVSNEGKLKEPKGAPS